MVKNIPDRPKFNDFSQVHYGNVAADLRDHPQIVGNIKDCHVELLLQFLERRLDNVALLFLFMGCGSAPRSKRKKFEGEG